MPDFTWLKNVSPGAVKLMETTKRAQGPVNIPFAPGTPVRRTAPSAIPTTPTHQTNGATGPQEVPGDTSMLGPEAGQVTKDFHIGEFKCKGTGQAKMSSDVISRLQQLRDHLGVAITVTSGYRSPEHNRRVGGVEGSLHTKGLAADIKAAGISMQRLADAARRFFPTAVVYGTHVHVDVGRARSW